MSRVKSANEKALKLLLEHRKEKQGFTFALRKKLGDKIENGLWFHGSDQGTTKYIFIGFYAPFDTLNKTPTIGIVRSFDAEKAYLEITWRSVENRKLCSLYEDIKNILVTANKGKVIKKSPKKFWVPYDSLNLETIINQFLTKQNKFIKMLIKKDGFWDDFKISEENFLINLERVNGYRV